MILYRLLNVVFPRSLLMKLGAVVVLLGMPPGLGAALVAMERVQEAWVQVALIVGGALVGAAAAVGALRLVLAPLWRVSDTLEAHARGWAVSPLPDGYDDEAGRLMRYTNTSLIKAADEVAASRREAEVDPLTGALNRRGLARALEAAPKGVLCVMDLDRFKQVNDRYGHEEGDRVLKAAAAAWRRSLREGDVLARHGGEEFAVFMPAADLLTAARRAGQLRRALSKQVQCGGAPVTASFGVAVHAGGPKALKRSLAKADAALYRAKEAGRDRVAVDGITVTDPPAEVKIVPDDAVIAARRLIFGQAAS